MASAAGFSSKLDSLLIQCIQSMPKQDAEDEYLISCLLMVFVAVSIPKLARSDSSQYKVRSNDITSNFLILFHLVCKVSIGLIHFINTLPPFQAQLEGHANNIHCLAVAVNQLFGVLFSLCGHDDIEDRLKEFLALASSSLLRLAHDQVISAQEKFLSTHFP